MNTLKIVTAAAALLVSASAAAAKTATEADLYNNCVSAAPECTAYLAGVWDMGVGVPQGQQHGAFCPPGGRTVLLEELRLAVIKFVADYPHMFDPQENRINLAMVALGFEGFGCPVTRAH
jgi:hypothetical protein